MQYLIKTAILGVALGAFLSLTVSVFETQRAQATPAIAKGQPCGNCHSGSPPSKQNLKK
jgi:hypothetical protein